MSSFVLWRVVFRLPRSVLLSFCCHRIKKLDVDVERLHAAAAVEIEALKGMLPLAIFPFLPFLNNISRFLFNIHNGGF